MSPRRKPLGPSRVLKARPARRAFVFLARLLLSGSPPPFDKVQQRLATATQTVTLLELVNERDGLTWQSSEKLALPLSRQPAAIGPHDLGLGSYRRNLHAAISLL